MSYICLYVFRADHTQDDNQHPEEKRLWMPETILTYHHLACEAGKSLPLQAHVPIIITSHNYIRGLQ